MHSRIPFLLAAVFVAAPRLSWSGSFQVPNSDCLVSICHGPAAARIELDIASTLDLNDPTYSDNDTALSQHNIEYSQDGDYDTIEATNECKSCHAWYLDGDSDGRDDATGLPIDTHRYVGTGNILRYPADYGLNTAGTRISRSDDLSTYQDFCLSCHDGSDVNPLSPGITEFNGPLGTNQVGPSDRGNPANQQGPNPPWVVPEVPPNAGGGSPPYFANYEVDGHGADLGAINQGAGWAMNVSCLAYTPDPNADPSPTNALQGCHSVHGSRNRFLIAEDGYDDSDNRHVFFGIGRSSAANAAGEFDTGIDSAAEFASPDDPPDRADDLGVCLRGEGCHTAGALADAVTLEWNGQARVNNEFHGSFLKNSGNPDPGHTNPNANSGGTRMAAWRQYIMGKYKNEKVQEKKSMKTNVGAGPTANLLPFYNNPVTGPGRIYERVYSPTLGPEPADGTDNWLETPPAAPHWIMCLSCHDPHGTGSFEGMLRIDFGANLDYTDPLCGECHLE